MAGVTASAVASVVAACGGKTLNATAPVPTPPTTTTSTSPTTTTSTSTTPTTTTPSNLCRAAGLALTFIGQQGATGHGELGFALRNTGSSSCQTGGYPGVLFLDKSGAPLPTTATRTTHDLGGSAPVRSLTVAPGQTVSFRLFVTHFGANGSTTGCATADSLQVIPPNDTAALKVAIPGGATECQTATVIPLQPGTSGYL